VKISPGDSRMICQSSDYFKINQNVYNELADEYQERHKLNQKQQKKLLSEFVKQLKHRFSDVSVLDVGCGVGINCKLLEEEKIHCTGIDFSSRMIEYAKKNSPDSKFILSNFVDYKSVKKFNGIILGAFLNLISKKDFDGIMIKIKNLLVDEGFILIYIRLFSETKEGILVKSNYSKKLKRFVRHWKKGELISVLEKYFSFISAKKGYGDENWYIFMFKNSANSS
jgi:predicted TPR repeat methyltransferase